MSQITNSSLGNGHLRFGRKQRLTRTFMTRLVRRVGRSSCLLEIDLVHLNFPIDQLIDINNHTERVNIHKNKARVNIEGDAAVCTCGRSRVYDNTTFMLVCRKLMSVACHKDVNIQLPLRHG